MANTMASINLLSPSKAPGSTFISSTTTIFSPKVFVSRTFFHGQILFNDPKMNPVNKANGGLRGPRFHEPHNNFPHNLPPNSSCSSNSAHCKCSRPSNSPPDLMATAHTHSNGQLRPSASYASTTSPTPTSPSVAFSRADYRRRWRISSCSIRRTSTRWSASTPRRPISPCQHVRTRRVRCCLPGWSRIICPAPQSIRFSQC